MSSGKCAACRADSTEAEQIKARVKQELESAKAKFEQVKNRISSEMHSITTKVKQIEDKLKHKFEETARERKVIRRS